VGKRIKNGVKTLKPIKVLLVADEEDEYKFITGLLSEIGYEEYQVDWIKTYADSCLALKNKPYYDVALVDYDIDSFAETHLIHEIQENDYQIPVILFSIDENREIYGEAESGAFCYLHKHKLTSSELKEAIHKAIMWKKLKVIYAVG
jgi:DNA-binding NtrC family response regulator